MQSREWVAQNLASAFLSGPWAQQAMTEAGRSALGAGRPPQWLRALVSEVLAQARLPYPPSPHELVRLILGSRAIRGVRIAGRKSPLFAHAVTAPASFAPSAAFRDLQIAQSDWINQMRASAT